MTPQPNAEPAISPRLTFTLALACGIVVANIYYVQPLVGLISRDFGMSLASAGVLVTMTQIGYAAGLLLIVPLGDILENRNLITVMIGLLIAALLLATVAPDATLFILASIPIGICASTVQIIVPLAGHLAPPAQRGRVVGNVVSGLLFGIMLSRPIASFVAHFVGHRSVFGLSAIALVALIIALRRTLPERRPAGMSYWRALASLGPLLAQTPALRRRSAYQGALFAAFSLFWTAIPLLLEGPAFRFSQVGIGLFALVGAAGALISPHAGKAADKGYTVRVTRLALGGAAVAFLVALAGGILVSWPLLVVAALVLDMAIAAHLVTGQQEIFAVNAEARGRLNGLYLAIFFLCGAFGSAIAGYAFAASGWSAVCVVALVFPLLALAYDTLLWRERAVPAGRA